MMCVRMRKVHVAARVRALMLRMLMLLLLVSGSMIVMRRRRIALVKRMRRIPTDRVTCGRIPRPNIEKEKDTSHQTRMSA